MILKYLISVLTKVSFLVACHSDYVMPRSKEAKRRLIFSSIHRLWICLVPRRFSWNVMTTYYSEDFTYTTVDLEQRINEFGISTLLYL